MLKRQDIGPFHISSRSIVLVAFLWLAACQPGAPTPKTIQKTIVLTNTVPFLPTITLTAKPTALPETPSPESCNETGGNTIREIIHSRELPGNMAVSIYTPPCYDNSHQYRVLFLLHGLTYKDDQWVRLGITELADRLISRQELEPFLIVMPYFAISDPVTESNFSKAMIFSVVPWVDEHYNTCTDARCRIIAGISWGGGWAFDIAFQAGGLFGSVAGHSPAMFIHDPQKLADFIGDNRHGERIWIDVGNKDKESVFLSTFSEALSVEQIPHQFVINEGTHEEEYWETHLETYLRWYLEE